MYDMRFVFPEIWALYKEMKSLDWDENEFNYSQCNTDFKNCDPSVSDMMIRTLAWQWEADSVASRSIIACFMPFISSSELFAAWCRVSDNEVVHSSTYSEIVRMSFDDPSQVLGDVLKIQESLQRLGTVGRVFSRLRRSGAEYQLGKLEYSQDLYNQVYSGVATLLMLERIQFMSSFAITFTICSTGVFQPIGKAVQKICQDELEVHCELDKEVIRVENRTDAGRVAKKETAGQLTAVFEEIVDSELHWVDYLFSEGLLNKLKLQNMTTQGQKSLDDKANSKWGRFKSDMAERAEAVTGPIADRWGRIKGRMGGKVGKAWELAKSAGSMIGSGISAAGGFLKNMIGETVNERSNNDFGTALGNVSGPTGTIRGTGDGVEFLSHGYCEAFP
jgi:ribonucleotide reductase beta subunit family protein with ferritin-like domain